MSFQFSNSDSSIPTLTLGLCILFTIGTIMGIYVKNRRENTTFKHQKSEEVTISQDYLMKLRERLSRDKNDLYSHKNRIAAEDEDCKKIAEMIVSNKNKINDLHAQKLTIVAHISTANIAALSRMQKFRDTAWKSAINEKHSSIITKTGKTYIDITISRVTQDGIEFVHAEGVTKLPHTELEHKWHNRFQWINLANDAKLPL